jgi:sodium transport system ATP-binding protein
MIRVEHLHKEFVKLGKPKFPYIQRSKEHVVAVEDVSFQAHDGAILGLLGANGAGKTTSLRMVASLLKPDAGQILVDGVSVLDHPMKTQERMGILSDARGLYPRLTARENIHYYAVLHGMEPNVIEQRIAQLVHWLDLGKIIDRRTDGFSQGERMKVGLARAIIHDPKNIILDEPTNGLDVVATRALREFLRWLRTPEGGSKCIVFSTHIMQEVEKLCDQVSIVANGKTVTEGSVEALKELAKTSDFEEAFVKLAFLPDQGFNASLSTTTYSAGVAI